MYRNPTNLPTSDLSVDVKVQPTRHVKLLGLNLHQPNLQKEATHRTRGRKTSLQRTYTKLSAVTLHHLHLFRTTRCVSSKRGAIEKNKKLCASRVRKITGLRCDAIYVTVLMSKSYNSAIRRHWTERGEQMWVPSRASSHVQVFKNKKRRF